MAQLAVTWVLHDSAVTSALIGASSVKQIEEIVAMQQNLELTEEELKAIETLLTK
jgi:L-glyceraldehyde 3-phosphate reductase